MKDYRQEILSALQKHGRILKRDYRRRYLPALKQLVTEGRVQVVMDDASHVADAPRRSRAWVQLRLRTARRLVLVPTPDPDEPTVEQVIASEPDLAEVQRTIDDEIQRRRASQPAQTSLPVGDPLPAREVVTECAKCGAKAYSVQQGYELFYRRSYTNKKGQTISAWQSYCKTCIKKTAAKATQERRLLKKNQTVLGGE